MNVDLISPVSSENFGGVERYALNLLDQFARIQTSGSFRLVNFPDSLSSRWPFERLKVGYHFRQTVSHLRSERGPAFLAASIDYLATNGPVNPPPQLVSGWNRQVGLSFGLEAIGPSAIVHGLTHFVPVYARSAKSIVTVHDVGPIRFPRLYPRAYVEYMRHEFARQVSRCARVIVDSPFTLEEVRECYRIPRERLALVPLGVEEAFRHVEPAPVLRRLGISRPYVYYPMGTIEPRKNLSAVSEAIRRVRTELHVDVDLVLTGRSLLTFPEVEKTIEEGVAAGYVRRLGFVDGSELPALYSGAECTVYPSLYEGFGLPVLESMACGTPIAISGIASLEYVAGDAGYRLGHPSADSIAAGLRALLSDPTLRSRLADAGLQRAREFSWETTARRTLEVYDSVT